MCLGLITCGEVEDVVRALTPVASGVAQDFDDLLVELRLLLVAEVEEGVKRKTDRRKAKRSTTWMAMTMVVKFGQDSNLSQM